MSGQQPNAWQTAGRGRHNHSASRTPQNRSSTASPSQQNPPSQPPKQEPNRPAQQAPNNVWSQRGGGNNASGSNGPRADATPQETSHVPAHGFNAAEVKAFLSRETAPAVYKPAEAAGAGRGNGGAWAAKANHMANNQPFFVQLAKQVATFEGGG